MAPAFDWDDGNWPKCGKHGVTKAEIEAMLSGEPLIEGDPFAAETRRRAIGRIAGGRWLYCVFTIRNGLVRPISARYRHAKEVVRYD